MEIDFKIGDTPAVLKRGWFLGGLKVEAANKSFWLQHPLHPQTHFSLRLERHWELAVAGHKVRVEKVRPLMLAGVRPQAYRIFVDGTQVASARGM